MSALADRFIDRPLRDDMELVVEDMVRTCSVNSLGAIRELILGQRQLMERFAGAVSTGYVRGRLG